MTVVGLVIPADSEQPIRRHEYSGDYREMQAVVGGLIQPVDMPSVNVTIWVNEEGKLMSLPLNVRATELLYEHEPAWRGHDVLVGDVLITGMTDDEGDTMSAPEEFMAALLVP